MTNKEFTGPEFEIEFHTRYLEWLKGGRVGVDPKTLWESLKEGKDVWFKAVTPEHLALAPAFMHSHTYRWKPTPKRMVTIGWYSLDGNWIEKELVAPEVEAPEIDTLIFYSNLEGIVVRLDWRGNDRQLALLKAGNIFLSREDAQAMADWQAVCRRSGA